MIPVKLQISGFLSYRDPVELDFSQFDLACISGPNGAGKSSLLDAITYVLFGQARARGDSLINSHKDVNAAQVTFTFNYEGNTYRVQRTTPRDERTLLEFQIQNKEGQWKALTERALRETEARIRETLRLDYETFVNASFFLQGKADQFTQENPTDRKRILGNVLGLEIWEQYRSKAADQRKALEDQIGVLQGRLQEIVNELGEEDQRKARLRELQIQLDSLSQSRIAQETAVDEMRRRASAAEQQAALAATLAAGVERERTKLDEYRARLAERQADQAGFTELLQREKEIEQAYKDWLAVREELARFEEVAGRFREQETRRNAPLSLIGAEKARLETALAALQTEKARVEGALAEKAELDKKLKEIGGKIHVLQSNLANRAKVEQELGLARKDHADAVGENPLLKAEMDETKARIDLLKSATGPVCPTCGQTLTDEHRELAIAQLTKEGKKMGDRYRANKQKQERTKKRVEELESQLSKLISAEEDLRNQSVQQAGLNTQLGELEKLEALWVSEGSPRMAELARSLETEDFAPEARAELAAIDAELKATGYDAAQHDAARKRELEMRSAEVEQRALEQARAASKPLEREIQDLTKQIAAQEKDLAAQEENHKQATETLAAMQAGIPDLQGAERAMLATQEQENQARALLGAAQQEVDVLETLRVRKKEIDAERDELAARVSQFKTLERAFGKDGVPAMLIEQALPQIETKANQILDRLSAGGMNIRFITQQQFKDSKRKDLRETLDILISDGAGSREYEMFSGGEAFRINFAIRLALSEVLAQRAGARLQTLVIDEGFGSQDEAGRQRLIEAINMVRQDFAKILVITHVEALKDAFPTRIEVEKSPRGSMVRVV